MQELIAAYLFQHKKCPLPRIGILSVRLQEAEQVPGEKIITVPPPEVIFSNHEADPAEFIEFISANKFISREEAGYLLDKSCEEMLALPPSGSATIPGAGKFIKDPVGKLIFVPAALPPYFLPDVPAERVVHADSSHSMLVGDKETSTAAMTEYYTDAGPERKKRGWVWAALILLLLSAATIIFYLNDDGHNAFFGTAHWDQPAPAGQTYRELP